MGLQGGLDEVVGRALADLIFHQPGDDIRPGHGAIVEDVDQDLELGRSSSAGVFHFLQLGLPPANPPRLASVGDVLLDHRQALQIPPTDAGAALAQDQAVDAVNVRGHQP